MIKKVILIGLLLAIISGIYVWFFVYNKSHRNIHAEKAVFEGTAEELRSQFILTDGSVDSSLLQFTVIISGNISDSESESFILGEACSVHLDSTTALRADTNWFKVKGLLIGVIEDDIMYGDLVKISQGKYID